MNSLPLVRHTMQCTIPHTDYWFQHHVMRQKQGSVQCKLNQLLEEQDDLKTVWDALNHGLGHLGAVHILRNRG